MQQKKLLMMRRIIQKNNLNSKKFEDEVNQEINAQSIDTSSPRSKRPKTYSLDIVEERGIAKT